MMIAKHSSYSWRRASTAAFCRNADRVQGSFDFGRNDNWRGDKKRSLSFSPSTVAFSGNRLQDDLNIDSSLAFMSPETALGFFHVGEMLPKSHTQDEINSRRLHEPILDSSLMWQSPETALGFIHTAELLESHHDDGIGTDRVLQKSNLDFSSMWPSPETAIGSIHFSEMLDDVTRSHVIARKAREQSLPRSLTSVASDPRPVVVTSAVSPFAIVEVNDAWVGLCEYSRDEAVNRSLADLLQGPRTDTNAAREMVKRLQEEDYAEAILTNYSKSGRKFDNFVKVAKLSVNDDNDAATELLVGVLEEIQVDSREDNSKTLLM